jgi:hypothetical protein
MQLGALLKQNTICCTQKKLLHCPNTYLHDICRKNPGSWQDIQINKHTGEFMVAFFAFGPAVELMKTVGRNVSGADFGHSTFLVYTLPYPQATP